MQVTAHQTARITIVVPLAGAMMNIPALLSADERNEGEVRGAGGYREAGSGT
jgi:hypothetical protein